MWLSRANDDTTLSVIIISEQRTTTRSTKKKQHKNAERTWKIHCKLRMNINFMNVNGIVMPSRYILKLLEWRERRMESPWPEQNKITDTRIKIYAFHLFFSPSLLLLSQLKLWKKIFFTHADQTVETPRSSESVQFVRIVGILLQF